MKTGGKREKEREYKKILQKCNCLSRITNDFNTNYEQ